MSENITHLVNTVLQSPALRSCIETCLGNNITPHASGDIHRPRNQNIAGNSSSAIEEVRRLFPSIRSSSNTPSSSGVCYSTRSPQLVRGTKRKRGSVQESKPITKDVILLNNPLQTRTLTGKNKAAAYNEGLALSAVQFKKHWSPLEVRRQIQELFQSKLQCEFEFLIPIGGYLIKPKLHEEEMNGENLAKLFSNKVIYVRPLIPIEADGFPVNENETQLNEEVTQQLNEERTQQLNQEETQVLTDFYTDEEAVANFNVKDADPHYTNLFEPTSLNEILTKLSEKINEEIVTKFNIYRDDVFNCCVRAMRRKSFEAQNRISVLFTDCDNNSEGAIDVGGPLREMFRLIFLYLSNSCLFGGPANRKFIALNKEALKNNLYYEAGRLMAMAMVHCGFGPRFLSEVFYTLLVESSDEIQVSLDDLTDPDVRSEIQQAIDCSHLNSLRNVICEGTFIGLAGWEVLSDFQRKDVMIKDVMRFYVVDRCVKCIEQFKEGLKTLEVYEYMKKYPEYFIELMCNTKESILTLSKFNELFTITYSSQGSNKRHVESRIVAFWKDYVIECAENEDDEDLCSLEELLTFVTAVNLIPCSGFVTQPSIEFLHDDPSIFPRGNTCGLQLYLPTVHTTYDEFKRNMTYGVKNGMVFGYA